MPSLNLTRIVPLNIYIYIFRHILIEPSKIQIVIILPLTCLAMITKRKQLQKSMQGVRSRKTALLRISTSDSCVSCIKCTTTFFMKITVQFCVFLICCASCKLTSFKDILLDVLLNLFNFV